MKDIIIGIDPGIDHFAWACVRAVTGRLPVLEACGKMRLDTTGASHARAAVKAVEQIPFMLPRGLSAGAVGVESFEHRPRFVDGGRRVSTGPRMGEVVAGVEWACDRLGVPFLRVPARDHKNQIPVYPAEMRCDHSGDCRHQHLRDAYSVACWTAAVSRGRTAIA